MSAIEQPAATLMAGPDDAMAQEHVPYAEGIAQLAACSIHTHGAPVSRIAIPGRNDDGRHAAWGALAIVVFGSMIGEWLGIFGLTGGLWAWFGNQGFEYLDLGGGLGISYTGDEGIGASAFAEALLPQVTDAVVARLTETVTGPVTASVAESVAATESRLLEHVDEAVLADTLGLDFFGVGEHHREDFAVSAPEVVLAAIAARHMAGCTW